MMRQKPEPLSKAQLHSMGCNRINQAQSTLQSIERAWQGASVSSKAHGSGRLRPSPS
ncbi:hypothetical protein CNECB9_5000004 [Cupriavidus necator]|uniref:Uncharacterized protein n=1 Tax=Cupriavidus necator TaxID=106590 RepID=A0A1K0INI6_CUPNE|nr:hypothetical protein CNECB9_5000004 [Cupriavidus necator]